MMKHLSLAVAVLLVAGTLAQAGVVNIVQTPNPGTSDAALDLTGTITNDIKLNSPGTSILSQQLRLVLTTGTIKDSTFGSNIPPTEALLGTFPNLAYDSFVAAGGPTSTSPSPTLVGRSDELGGPGGVPAFFTATEYDALWGPSLGQDTADKTGFLSARLTLSGNATGTLSYRAVFGDTTELMQNINIVNGVIGGGGGGDTADPVVTALTRDFTLKVTDPATLQNLQLQATDATGPIVWSSLLVEGPGKNAAFPSAADPTITPAGLFSWNPNGWKNGAHTFKFNVADSASPANTAEGVLALTVNLTVPEPATMTMFGLALVGFVGIARRRS